MNDVERSDVVIAPIIEILSKKGSQDGDLMEFEQLNLENEFQPFFLRCIVWLGDQGLIRFDEISRTMGGGGWVHAPVLTSYGFSTINRQITLGGEDLPMKDAISHVSKSGGNYASAGDFFGGFLGGFTKSMGS